MLIDFNKTKEITVPGMNNGTGMMTAKMYVDEQGKVIPCSIHADGSIGFTYYCCRAINSSLPKYISNFPYFTGFPACALAK